MHNGLPVEGYSAQSELAVQLVNNNKQTEECILRLIDSLLADKAADLRWLEEARVHLEIGFMALNRAIFQPRRVKLPEDEGPATLADLEALLNSEDKRQVRIMPDGTVRPIEEP